MGQRLRSKKKYFSVALNIILIITFALFTLSCNVIDEEIMKETTKFIAHRGLSSLYYQNTMQAFEQAAQRDFFSAIETDIWITSDNVWLCAHDNDPFLDKSKLISEITYTEAMSLPLDPLKAGENVNTEDTHYLCDFQSYLSICKMGNKEPIIELKNQPTLSQIQDLLAFVDSIIGTNKVQFISFHKENIDHIQSIDHSVTTQLLTSKYTIALTYIYKGYNIGISHSIATPYLIKRAKAKNIKVNVWTVNEEQKVKDFLGLGIDYITTYYEFNLS